MYNNPPTPVMASPIHHNRSALMCCTTCFVPCWLSNFNFQFSGTSGPSADSPRFDFEDAVWLVVRGLRVVVGSICGGVMTRYMGFTGEPSNL